MAFQRVPNTAQIELRYSATGTPWVNTVYAQYPLGYTATELDTLADAVEAWAENGVITQLSSEATYDGVTVRGLNAEYDLIASRSPVSPVPGLAAGGSSPLNVAWVVKFLSGLTGRSTRGRNYIAGIPESIAGRTTVSVGWCDAIVTEYNQLKAAIFAAGWTMVIVSRYTALAKRPEGVTFPVVTVTYTDTRIDTRRSRLNNT